MADDTTKLIISVETLLKGLDKTLAGLSKVESQLKRVATVKVGGVTGTDKVALAAQRLANQQQKLAIQTQELANRQVKADLVAQRLAKSTGQQANAHVKAFKAIQRGVVEADNHVRFFRANERALAKAPQLDAHVKAFRRLEEAAGGFNQRLIAAGNAARSFGQGLSSLGFTITTALSVPLAALGVASLNAAVTLDSLRRGLAAITGSADKAAVQLKRLEEIAKLPGIGFEEAIQGSIRLQAVGFSAEQAETALREFANAVALTGGGRDELARVTVQLGQLASKGKVLSQDLRPIIEAAPAVATALKEAFGTVVAEDIAELTGSSEEFLKVLLAGLAKLPRAAAGARNSLENFRDTVFRAAAAVGDAILPVLTRLIEIAGPAITALAEGFKSLPRPMQIVGVLAGGLLVLLGPAVILLGSLVTGIGRLAVALGQLGTLGLLPTVANLKLLTASAVNATAAITGLQAATIRAAGPWIALAAVLATVAAAFFLLRDSEEEAAVVDVEAAKARRERLKAAEDELRFLEGLTRQTSRTSTEEKRLAESYASLNSTRLAGIQLLDTETQKLEQLIIAKREQLKIDQFQVQATTAQLAGNVLIELSKQIDAEKRLAEAKADVADAEGEAVRLALSRGVIVSQVDRERVAQQFLNDALNRGGRAMEDFNRAGTEVGKAIKVLADVTGKSTEEIIAQIKAAGGNERALQLAAKAAEELARVQNIVEAAVNDATQAIVRQNDELEKSFARDPNVIIAKSSKKLLDATLDFVKANTDGIDQARRALQNYIDLFPVLKKAVEDAGGIDEVIRKLFHKPKGDAGTALRNAQEQLADAIAEVTQAQAERQLRISETTNDTLLQANEASFRLQLRSYEEYLDTRARLTINALNTEIALQQAALDTEVSDFLRLRDAAKQAGLPERERLRRRAQAADAQKRATEAETKLLELEEKRTQIELALSSAQRESLLQQVQNIRQLEIEYAELQGNIESAFKAETLERFRERLEALSREQNFISQRLNLKSITAEERKRLRVKRDQNQAEIELIESIVRSGNAVAELKAAEQLVSNAKEKQLNLERDLEFQVQFRGLAEEEAIKRRLEGEAKVRNSLELARLVIEDTIRQMRERFGPNVPVPKALLDFLRDMKAELQGLGKLSLPERFRLAQKEFDRLNNERIRKIQEVERAVAHRDISELQGRIAIKLANGEYIGALEQQLVLLRAIAAQSGDIGLLRQADDAATVAAEVRNASTEVAGLETELRSVSIDALRDGFADFFTEIARGADNAREALLNMLNSVLSRINQVIANRIADKLIEALFGGLSGGGGGQGAIGGLGSVLGGLAEGDIVPARPQGRIIRVAEGGYDEAILTTDPRYAQRQVAILREYIKQTRGLWGRIPEFAEGAIVSAGEAEANLLRTLNVSRGLSIPAPSPSMQLQSAAAALNLRNINLFDRRQVVSSYLRSAEGTRDILNVVSSERDEIGRRIGVRQ